MKRMFLIHVALAAICATGCSTPSTSNLTTAASPNPTPPKPDLTLFQGAWTGHDITAGQDESASLKISGQTLDFHGADANDWVKGTFTLREETQPKQFVGIITECAAPEYVGNKMYSIYQLKDGVLTITGSAPGDSNFPSSFDAPGTREFVFRHDR
jgi:uncharacterized protein (TIGR03067 family)